MRNAMRWNYGVNMLFMCLWLIKINEKCSHPMTVEDLLGYGNPDNSWKYQTVEGVKADVPYWDKVLGGVSSHIMLLDVSNNDEYNAGCWWRNHAA